jgi:hypothetical protein
MNNLVSVWALLKSMFSVRGRWLPIWSLRYWLWLTGGYVADVFSVASDSGSAFSVLVDREVMNRPKISRVPSPNGEFAGEPPWTRPVGIVFLVETNFEKIKKKFVCSSAPTISGGDSKRFHWAFFSVGCGRFALTQKAVSCAIRRL